MVEVAIGGDQSVDRNGGTEGKRRTHLNTARAAAALNTPPAVVFVEGGGEGGERNNTHCVVFPSWVFLFCVKFRIYCKLNMTG